MTGRRLDQRSQVEKVDRGTRKRWKRATSTKRRRLENKRRRTLKGARKDIMDTAVMHILTHTGRVGNWNELWNTQVVIGREVPNLLSFRVWLRGDNQILLYDGCWGASNGLYIILRLYHLL